MTPNKDTRGINTPAIPLQTRGVFCCRGILREQTNLPTHTPGCPYTNRSTRRVDSEATLERLQQTSYGSSGGRCDEEPRFDSLGCSVSERHRVFLIKTRPIQTSSMSLASVMSRDLEKASACCFHTSCAILCQMVPFRFSSCSSLHRLAGLTLDRFLS